ncbi:methyltransferase domain-containing protein [Scytonema sp. UIC 10036]|uniref:class I SAM-dependent methyltransferase n=1 Tax=Scytonema sp. UIC 10036 TaxID=2304196 RepID=UPI0012DAA69B|nr:class I SAM-dependent methyltransferase [Scytonema sp. UIC 10036]MUG96313.1 methyltransferase domain-containing protein [Scytonema sp. UIC 10036]
MAEAQLPNYEQIANRFDMWIPYLTPVSEALLKHLPVDSNNTILDIACGTGEPGLSLARKHISGVRIVGIDSVPGMVSVAAAKAKSEGLNNIEFLVMKAENLSFADSFFDGVMSRFGLMLLDNPNAGCSEMLRVLKIGGHYAVAVWDEPEKNTFFFSFARSFNEQVSVQNQLPITLASRLAGANALPTLLNEGGASEITTELFEFEMKFSSFKEIWALVEDSGIFDAQFGLLSVDKRLAVREGLEKLFSGFKHNSGYLIPHCCRLVWGKR